MTEEIEGKEDAASGSANQQDEGTVSEKERSRKNAFLLIAVLGSVVVAGVILFFLSQNWQPIAVPEVPGVNTLPPMHPEQDASPVKLPDDPHP